MSTQFLIPLPFTAVSGNVNSLNPLSNLNIDYASLVWRSANLTTVHMIVDMGASAYYDTVALINSNLRSTDLVRVQTGTTSTGTGSYDSGTFAAYTGNKAAIVSTKTVKAIGARTERYVRIDITATSHPAGFVEAQRLVIGQAIVTTGMDSDAEQGFDDRSVVNQYPGGETIDAYAVLPSWKFSTGWISDFYYREYIYPMLLYAGTSNAILFIPDDTAPTHWQHEVIFGRFTTVAKGKHQTYDLWSIEGTITALAP